MTAKKKSKGIRKVRKVRKRNGCFVYEKQGSNKKTDQILNIIGYRYPKVKYFTLDQIDEFKCRHKQIYDEIDPIVERKRKERKNKRLTKLNGKLLNSLRLFT